MMPEQWAFCSPVRILFGVGTSKDVPALAGTYGRRLLVVTGSGSARVQSLVEAWTANGGYQVSCHVQGEPTLESISEMVQIARESEVDVIVGWGGGSVLDAAKAVAALLTNGGDPLNYLEIVGRGEPLSRPALPMIAVPTTAGTGAEVTRNAVIGVPGKKIKVSLRHDFVLPRYAVIDPALTYTMPPEVTAYTGFDALTQCLEAFINCHGNPLLTALCREGLQRARSLERVWMDGSDEEARSDMSLSALCSGLALSHIKLGAVHGIAGPFGGMYGGPHGAICARLLVPVIRMNVELLRKEYPQHPALDRYTEAARILTGSSDAVPEDLTDLLSGWADQFGIKGLSSYGLVLDSMDELIQKALASSSMKGNPVLLRPVSVRDVLAEAF